MFYESAVRNSCQVSGSLPDEGIFAEPKRGVGEMGQATFSREAVSGLDSNPWEGVSVDFVMDKGFQNGESPRSGAVLEDKNKQDRLQDILADLVGTIAGDPVQITLIKI